jgi:glycine betaine/proline transport system substrate-binding protein
MKRLIKAVGCAALVLASQTPWAAEQAACQNVRMGVVAWTDVVATSAMGEVLLESLGYSVKQTNAVQQIIFAGIRDNRLDVFLGYWKPAMDKNIAPFLAAKQVKVLEQPSLADAQATLAVPDYVYQGGLKTFADIARFKDKLDGKNYGIEPGNDGNRLVQGMIDKNQFGLGKFKLVESSEAGMLSQVQRASRRNQWLVFLGWEPHPMNTRFKMKYMEGGDDVFGPNYGGATIYTNVRKGYAQECSNVGQLLKNLTFTLDMENKLMDAVLNGGKKPEDAAKAWLKDHPELLDAWLAGVTTRDGKPAIAVAKAAFAK